MEMIKSTAIVSSILLCLRNMAQKHSFFSLEFEPLAYPFLSILLNLSVMILEKFFPKTLPQPCFCSCKKANIQKERINQLTEVQSDQIAMKDISLVMEKMGLNLTRPNPMKNDSMTNEDFVTIFDDSEPSLDEVKEAFSVFDMNNDGFFDARDLQRVLINLGIKEGLDLNVCELMIEEHDRNRNGMIDLRDFSRVLETGLI